MKKKHLAYAGIAGAVILVLMFIAILSTGTFSIFPSATIDPVPAHTTGDLVVITGKTTFPAGTRLSLDIVDPSPGGKRAKAPTKIQPASHVELSVLDRFLASNETLREVISQAQRNDVNRIRFKNPFVPGIRFTVGTGFEILVLHERRHLLQAERARNAANFPAST